VPEREEDMTPAEKEVLKKANMEEEEKVRDDAEQGLHKVKKAKKNAGGNKTVTVVIDPDQDAKDKQELKDLRQSKKASATNNSEEAEWRAFVNKSTARIDLDIMKSKAEGESKRIDEIWELLTNGGYFTVAPEAVRVCLAGLGCIQREDVSSLTVQDVAELEDKFKVLAYRRLMKLLNKEV
jgi:hypothetical protein